MDNEKSKHRPECECDACYSAWLEYQSYPAGDGGARRCIAENEKIKELNAKLLEALRIAHGWMRTMYDVGLPDKYYEDLVKAEKIIKKAKPTLTAEGSESEHENP